jgi:hypothetical protein
MMKKLLVCLLAFSLLCALSVSALAAEIENGSGDVNVSVDADGNGVPDDIEGGIADDAIVYSVIVRWESMDFMFSGAWDAEDAEYKGTWMTKDDNTWAADNEQKLNVENRSNAGVLVKATMDQSTKNGVSASLSANAAGATLSSAAVEGAVVDGVGPNVDFTVTVSGNPTVSGDFKIGTITVTFGKVIA